MGGVLSDGVDRESVPMVMSRMSFALLRIHAKTFGAFVWW